jgi:hypothetical protein
LMASYPRREEDSDSDVGIMTSSWFYSSDNRKSSGAKFETID